MAIGSCSTIGLLPWVPFFWKPLPLRWRYVREEGGRRRVCSLADLLVAKDALEEGGLPTAQLFPVPGYVDP